MKPRFREFHFFKETSNTTNKQQEKSTAISLKECYFCRTRVTLQQQLKIALAVKYTASQNFFYVKEVTDVLMKRKCGSYIRYQDYRCLDSGEEHLKRRYKARELPDKLSQLTEYYKYHNEVPRIFIQPVVKTLNKYHDKMRHIEYNRITALLYKKKAQVNIPPPPKDMQQILNDQSSYQSIFKKGETVADSSLFLLKQKLSGIVQDISFTYLPEHNTINQQIQDHFEPKQQKLQGGELMQIYKRFLEKNSSKLKLKKEPPQPQFLISQRPQPSSIPLEPIQPPSQIQQRTNQAENKISNRNSSNKQQQILDLIRVKSILREKQLPIQQKLPQPNVKQILPLPVSSSNPASTNSMKPLEKLLITRHPSVSKAFHSERNSLERRPRVKSYEIIKKAPPTTTRERSQTRVRNSCYESAKLSNGSTHLYNTAISRRTGSKRG